MDVSRANHTQRFLNNSYTFLIPTICTLIFGLVEKPQIKTYSGCKDCSNLSLFEWIVFVNWKTFKKSEMKSENLQQFLSIIRTIFSHCRLEEF